MRKIVVAMDFSACSREARALAPRLAGAFGSELIPVNLLVESPLWSDSPFNMDRVRELLALLGSVVDRVVRLAPCPMLTVRGPA